jgi:hypothetical protein
MLTHICSAVSLSNARKVVVTVDADSTVAAPKHSRACEGSRGCNMKPDAAVAACRLMEHLKEQASTHNHIIVEFIGLLRSLLGARDPRRRALKDHKITSH